MTACCLTLWPHFTSIALDTLFGQHADMRDFTLNICEIIVISTHSPARCRSIVELFADVHGALCVRQEGTLLAPSPFPRYKMKRPSAATRRPSAALRRPAAQTEDLTVRLSEARDLGCTLLCPVPDDALPYLFERWFRPSWSRSVASLGPFRLRIY